jgi:alkylhydroperoxidase family enzyme
MDSTLKKMYKAAIKRTGDAAFIQSAANAPELLHWYHEEFYGKLFYSGRVEIRVKELIRLKLSKIHGCAY